MTDPTAFRIGQIFGIIIFLTTFVALAIFFVVALIKAIKTRKAGWIIGATLSGLPFVLLMLALTIGFAVGFKRGLNRSMEIKNAKNNQPSQLLTAATTPIAGNTLAYQISVPWLSEWQRSDRQMPFDHILSYHDAYVGIIAEGIGMGTPQRACDFAQKNIAARATEFSATQPTPINIDSRTWLTFDATATIRGIKIKYRYYIYSDSDYSFQIMTWTGPILFNHFAPVFDRIAQTFKFPASLRQ